MTTATMETEYTVLDETDAELESLAATADVPEKKRRGRPPRAKTADASAPDAEAEEMAALMRDMANTAAKEGFSLALEGSRKEFQGLVDGFRDYVKKQSELYAKPQNLCMHVKFNEQKALKLKMRAAKILPELLVQVDIGRNGGKWPLMMGPTGSGKTVAAEQVAEVLKLPFEHINCSEGMSETWLWGRQTPGGFIPGGLWKCFKDGGVFLFDEADAANDNVWLSINTMLANGHAFNPICGESAKRHKDFVAVAAANTNGKGGTGSYTGRSRLDGATLNRFSMYAVEYCTDLERELCPDAPLLKKLHGIREELTKKGSADVISTRDIKEAYMQQQRGFDLAKILGCLKLRMDKANQGLFEAKSKGGGKDEIPF